MYIYIYIYTTYINTINTYIHTNTHIWNCLFKLCIEEARLITAGVFPESPLRNLNMQLHNVSYILLLLLLFFVIIIIIIIVKVQYTCIGSKLYRKNNALYCF